MKRILALILSIIMLSTCCLTASASDTFGTAGDSASAITPRFTHITLVSATIGERSLGFVLCASTYNCMLDDYTFTLTCTLQRTDGTTGWLNYKTETQTFTELGTNGIEKTWFAPAGYAYRTHTTIVVKNARTSKVVETATVSSPTIYK